MADKPFTDREQVAFHAAVEMATRTFGAAPYDMFTKHFEAVHKAAKKALGIDDDEPQQ